jgi:hypothetical protein
MLAYSSQSPLRQRGPRAPGAAWRLLRQIAHADSRLSQVRRAIDWIREHMAQPLRRWAG